MRLFGLNVRLRAMLYRKKKLESVKKLGASNKTTTINKRKLKIRMQGTD
jgi:hypothetical protein